MVIVRYDGALSTAGGTRVETRRFEARVPADGTAATVGPALNQAANQVAIEVARVGELHTRTDRDRESLIRSRIGLRCGLLDAQ